MNKIGLTGPGSNNKRSNKQSGVSPFARALAETEKRAYNQKPTTDNNLFGEALAKTGGELPDSFDRSQFPFDQEALSPEDLLAQQQEVQRKEALRQKLHDRVNPVDQQEVFNAQEKRTQEELEKVREELKKLSTEIAKFHKDIDIQVHQQVVKQGREGAGLKSFFKKLREFIILLTKQVKSARTWMQEQNKVKSRRKIRGGILLAGRGAQESKGVFDMMHHERSTVYSGA